MVSKFKPKRLHHPIPFAYKWLIWKLHFVINWIETSGDLFGVFYCEMCEILMKVFSRFGMRFNTSRVINISPFCQASNCGFRMFKWPHEFASQNVSTLIPPQACDTPHKSPIRQCKLRRIKIHDAQNSGPRGVCNERAIKYRMHN